MSGNHFNIVPSFQIGKSLRQLSLRLLMVFLAVVITPITLLKAQLPQILITGDRQSSVLAENIEFLEDDTNKMSAEDILQKGKFQRTSNQIPVFKLDVKNAWFKMDVANQSASNSLFLDIAYSNLSKVTLYRIDSGKLNMLSMDGNAVPTDSVQRKTTHFVFDLQLPQGSKGSYLLHINSEHPIIIPASIHTYESLNETLNTQTLVAGIYMGVMLVMFLYNLFIFSATRDRNYLLYIFYIFFLTLAQSTLAGYGFRFLWPDYPSVNHYAVVITSSLSAISGLLFTMQFLQTSVNSLTYHRIMQALIAIYFIGMGICMFTNYLSVSYVILILN